MKIITMSESGDWFLIPAEKEQDFYEDELNETADYAHYIARPESVKILAYKLDGLNP